MSGAFMRFPNFKGKALTLSYDDGVRQDKRLIAIMVKYGLKGTFNINGGLFSEAFNGETKGRMTKEEALELYEPAGMEVAVHGYKHISLARVDSALAVEDVFADRKSLESMFGHVIKGMAYANGSYDDSVVEMLKQCGMQYSRTTISTENFELPTDWLRLPATCHHNNPRLMELAKQFVGFKNDTSYFWAYRPRLFYLWGHSYEFDNNDNWQAIEDFAAYVGGREDIWYATNGEIYAYIQAFDRLEWSADGSYVYNPSSINVFINVYGVEYIVPAGKMIKIG